MTLPTPQDDLYRWHTQALEDLSLHLDLEVTDEVHCGWFKMRMVKGGPFVPAKTWLYSPVDEETGDLISDEVLQCEINGKYADPIDKWSWICSHPITEAEFNYLTATLAWTAENAPDEPMANVGEKVDWSKVPVPVFNKTT